MTILKRVNSIFSVFVVVSCIIFGFAWGWSLYTEILQDVSAAVQVKLGFGYALDVILCNALSQLVAFVVTIFSLVIGAFTYCFVFFSHQKTGEYMIGYLMFFGIFSINFLYWIRPALIWIGIWF